MVGRIIAPHRCPHINSWNLWIYYLIWESDFACMIRLRTFTWGEFILKYLGRPNVITEVHIGNRGRRTRWRGDMMTEAEERGERDINWFENVAFLALKMETRKAGKLFPLEAGKDKEMDSPLSLWKEYSSTNTFIVLNKTYSGLPTSRGNKFLLF